nr:retrotransposon protein, putative, Ty1-copia subclass [Tanacetum cinerariifolium]
SGPTWLFDIDSLTRTISYQPVTAGNQTNPSAGFQDQFAAEKAGEEIDQQYVLFSIWSSGSTNPHNNDEDDAFDRKEPNFMQRSLTLKSLFLQAVVLSQGNKMTRPRKRLKASHVESFTRYRDLSAEFEDCSDNSINEVNAASTIVPTVGKNSLNITNTFSAADITYSDVEDDVGAEADFNSLETSITRNPRGYIKLSKIQVGLKQCRKKFFNSRCKRTPSIGFMRPFDCSVTVLNTLDPLGKFDGKADEGFLVGYSPESEVHVSLGNSAKIKKHDDMTKREAKGKSPVELSTGFRNLNEEFKDFSSINEVNAASTPVPAVGQISTNNTNIFSAAGPSHTADRKSASTPIDTEKPLLKEPDGKDVDVHTYRSMIGSLMYLTSSRPDIMFACKKQTVIATSSTEAKYVAAASCCVQVLWIQNQLLDYGLKENDFSSLPNRHPLRLIRINALNFLWTSFLNKDILLRGMISSTSSHLESIPVPKYTLYPFSEVPVKTWKEEPQKQLDIQVFVTNTSYPLESLLQFQIGSIEL